MTTWFTSDEHIGHANIIAYSARPFTDVDHMREELVRRHNARVDPGDFVWHLGDVALDHRLVGDYLRRLHGTHFLVPGNHDKCHPRFGSKGAKMVETYRSYGFDKVFGLVESRYFPFLGEVLLSHMPYASDDADARYPQYRPVDDGFRLLCGHIHEKWKRRGRMLNVGVDRWQYTPVSVEEVATSFRANDAEERRDTEQAGASAAKTKPPSDSR